MSATATSDVTPSPPAVGSRWRDGRRDLWHVRGIVDEHVVICTWSRTKRFWWYEVKHLDWFRGPHPIYVEETRERAPKRP